VRINKQKSFTKGRAHINGIEAFWSFTKRRLAKFNGVKPTLIFISRSTSGVTTNLLSFYSKTY
jgi:transposase-like protein